MVIGMGLLIVGGLVLLAYGVVRKAGDPDFRPFADGGAGEAMAGAFGEVAIDLPAGCEILEMRPEDDKLYLRIGPSPECRRVLVLDAATGSLLGTIRIAP